MKTLLYSFFILLPLTRCYPAHAQVVASADSSMQAALAWARQPYTQATLAETRLLSGTEYINYSRPNSVGHQFFQSNIAQAGSILYDGQLFTGVPMFYDLKLDQVVVPDLARNTSQRLLAEKIAGFNLGGHQFVRLVSADTTSRATVPTGFYDVLLAGSPSGAALLARRTKRDVEEPVNGRLVFTYEQKDQLLLRRNNTLTLIDNLKSILAALPEQRAALQKFARSNRLKFRGEHQEEAATALLRYYNTLGPRAAD
jgi:hypothetical protein